MSCRGSFITRKVEEVPVRFGNSRLMMMSEARSTAVVAGFQFDDPVDLHPDNVPDVGEDRDAAPA